MSTISNANVAAVAAQYTQEYRTPYGPNIPCLSTRLGMKRLSRLRPSRSTADRSRPGPARHKARTRPASTAKSPALQRTLNARWPACCYLSVSRPGVERAVLCLWRTMLAPGVTRSRAWRWCARAPGLISVRDPAVRPVGDVMVDGVIPRGDGCGRSVFLGSATWSWRQQHAGSRPRCIGVREDCARTWTWSARLQRLVFEFAQRVVPALEQLAGDGQAGTVAAEPSSGLFVIGLVGAAGAPGELRRLIERPAQRGRALAGQMPGSPALVGLVDGDVQAGVANGMPRREEPVRVAELGEDRDRRQRADPVVAHQGPAAGLAAAPVGTQLARKRRGLGVEGVDDAQWRASARSVLARFLLPRRVLVSAGSARCTSAPIACSSSTTNRQPVVASSATSRSCPAKRPTN